VKRSCVYTWDCLSTSLLQGFLRPSVSGVWHSSLTLSFSDLSSAEVAGQKHITAMKTLKMKMLPLLLLATISLLFPACDGNNPVNGNDEDLEGVTTVYMKSGDYRSGNPTLVYPFFGQDSNSGSGYFYIDEDNNFFGSWDFVDVGKKKLSQITTVPSSGWQRKVAVIPGHGYIINSAPTYIKIYVVDWIKNTYGGIIGAEVQYCEWNPNGSSNGNWNW